MLYDSWEEWTRHEQWAHQQRIWRCSEHSQREYAELATYEDHVRTYHAASVHQLLSSELLNSQQSVSQVCDRPCPFCQRDFERSIDLQQHIAGHLESIALLSLPNLDEMNESFEVAPTNSNSANRNYAGSRASDFDTTAPLAFSENDIWEDSSVMTKADKEFFRLKLKAESDSFESMNDVDVEARQAYSIKLCGGWLSRLPDQFDEESIHWFTDPESQTGQEALVESLQDLVDAFTKIRDQLTDQVAKIDITNLIAEMKSTSAAIWKLDKVIRGSPNQKDYRNISQGLTTVTARMCFTFRDVRRRLEVLDRAATTPVGLAQMWWENMNSLYGMEGDGSLARRLKISRCLLQELTHTLTEV